MVIFLHLLAGVHAGLRIGATEGNLHLKGRYGYAAAGGLRIPYIHYSTYALSITTCVYVRCKSTHACVVIEFH